MTPLIDPRSLIREAVAADAARMRECVHAAYEHYIERIGKPPGPMLDDYEQVAAGPDSYVVELDARIAGMLVLIESTGRLLLDNVAVHPFAQGRGIGRALVGFAEAEARSRGFGAIDLYTNELMTENIARYTKLGYEEVERKTERGFNRVYMRKRV
ncbi:MAG: GNAT family N-acetyltransferase [Gammaproteobacteria bacterium]